MYPTIELFNLQINVYYLLIFISFIIMSVINILRSKKYDINWYFGIIIAFIVNIFAILGAHLLFRIEHIGVDNTGFGLSFFGTVWFLPLMMFLVSFIFKKDINRFSDYWALTIPMELAIVRFGCFLSGCCLGIIANNGVHFPFDPEGVYRIPIQLYEAFFDILIFIFLIIIEKNKKISGFHYPIFMTLYGLIRFILEFYRETPKLYYGLSNGQIFAFVTFIIGIVIILVKFNYFLIKNKEYHVH